VTEHEVQDETISDTEVEPLPDEREDNLVPEPTARSAVRRCVTRGEGTNSARIFTPGEKERTSKV
jgi:hypothetical protein